MLAPNFESMKSPRPKQLPKLLFFGRRFLAVLAGERCQVKVGSFFFVISRHNSTSTWPRRGTTRYSARPGLALVLPAAGDEDAGSRGLRLHPAVTDLGPRVSVAQPPGENCLQNLVSLFFSS